jgi:quinol monooxygenase YgiN
MTTMIARHTVSDYGKWKSVYDDLAPVRKESGVIGASVGRDPDDGNTIIVVHRFNDLDAARAFAQSKDLKEAMAEAGVVGAPEFWFAEEVEQTPY